MVHAITVLLENNKTYLKFVKCDDVGWTELSMGQGV
jgi:hypothetical protein